MTLKCSNCGAPLQAAPDQMVVTCRYCQAVTRIDSTRRARPRATRGTRNTRAAWFGLVAVAGTAVIAAIVIQKTASFAPPPAPPRTVQRIPAPPVAQPAPAPAPPIDPLPHETTPDAGVQVTVTPKTRRKPVEAAPTGPVSTKKQAEEILRPELLACMKEHGVHYLITRLGNNRRGATVPALGLTGTSIVDYKPTPGFAATPLGRCVARAASGVRAPAYGGNYIYFGLRNESIPDPLADAPARLDTNAAKQALAALDDEARDCTTRSPSGSRPGESVSVMVFFEGATGEVSKIEPYYVDVRSAYGRCLSSVYRKATVGKFREIEHKVLHVLAP